MFRFLHAADLHLDSPLRRLQRYEGAPLEQIRGASRQALERLVDLARQRQVDFVLIAGDVYDGDWQDYQSGLFFANQMARLGQAGIPVVMIRGNHDAQSVITRRLPLPENVTLLAAEAPQTWRHPALDVAVHGQSFLHREVTDDLAAGYPDPLPGLFNIGLLHTCASGQAVGDHAAYAPCSVAELAAKGYDYWALGHVHDRRCLCDDPPIWFSGNLQGRHPKETGAKGCLLVEVDDAGSCDVTFQPVDVFRWQWLQVDLSQVVDETALSGVFRDQLQRRMDEHADMPLAMRVTLGGDTPLHDRLHADPEQWLNRLRAEAIDAGGGLVWIEQVKLATRLPLQLRDQWPDDGPIGQLRSYIQRLRSGSAADDDLARLASELNDLRAKLPPELRGAEGLDFDNPQLLLGLLDDVEPLLLSRLQAEDTQP